MADYKSLISVNLNQKFKQMNQKIKAISEQGSSILNDIRIELANHGLSILPNDQKLIRLKNKHQGQPCFIIGNGPSLQIRDLERLKKKVTLGVNKIYLAFEETNWRPTYYLAADRVFFETCHNEIERLNTTKIFPDYAQQYLSQNRQTVFYRENNSKYSQKYLFRTEPVYQPAFSSNILETVFGGYTVIYNALQVAFFMGIREVYLIGIDHNWVLSDKQVDHPVYKKVLVSEGESNHFHADYHKPGEPWAIPRLDLKEISYQHAKQFYENHGGIIYNATKGGKLEIFPRISFDDLV